MCGCVHMHVKRWFSTRCEILVHVLVRFSYSINLALIRMMRLALILSSSSGFRWRGLGSTQSRLGLFWLKTRTQTHTLAHKHTLMNYTVSWRWNSHIMCVFVRNGPLWQEPLVWLWTRLWGCVSMYLPKCVLMADLTNWSPVIQCAPVRTCIGYLGKRSLYFAATAAEGECAPGREVHMKICQRMIEITEEWLFWQAFQGKDQPHSF